MGRGLGNGTLVPHPDFAPVSVRGIEVMLACGGDGRWLVEYRVEGADDLIAPPPARPQRTDELWKHSCFELFVRPDRGSGYYEFNFSPSGEWAAYRFSDYRAGMNAIDRSLPVSCGRLDREGRLIDAESRLAELNLRAGGEPGAPLAVPQIATLARLAQRLGIAISRNVVAADGEDDLDLWVRAEPEDGGVRLEVSGWRQRPACPFASISRATSA